MKNINQNNLNVSYKKVATLAGMVAVIFYIIVSLRNIYQVVVNYELLLSHSDILSVFINVILYLFVVAIGVEAVRRNNLYIIVIALVSILIIY
ncbi:hypothetical protein RZE82_02545 [Mollicutes bacterium LVI A0039]|nr:hypothetical protein RZE82_02545 [Mollicutes bacterium LVI A0039]